MASKEIPQGKTLPRSPQGPLTRSARKRAEEAAARRRLQQQDLDANPDAENEEQEDADEEVIGTPTRALVHSSPPLYFRTDTCLLLLPGFVIHISITNNLILSISI